MKMNKALVSLLFVPFFAWSQSSSDKIGWSKKRVSGRVEEMIAKTYKAILKNDKIEPVESDIMLYEKTIFDNAGNFVEIYQQVKHNTSLRKYKKNTSDWLQSEHSSGSTDTVIYTNGLPDSIISKRKQDGIIMGTAKIKLDKDGNIAEQIRRDKNGTIIETIKSTYYKGQVKQELVMDGSNYVKLKREYEIESDGELKSVTYFQNDFPFFTLKYAYADFDESGNWTTKIEYKNGNEPFSITKRSIRYFNKQR